MRKETNIENWYWEVGSLSVMNLIMWFFSLWNGLPGGMWKNLKPWGREALECSKSLMGHSGRSLEKQNTIEKTTDSANWAYEVSVGVYCELNESSFIIAFCQCLWMNSACVLELWSECVWVKLNWKEAVQWRMFQEHMTSMLKHGYFS